MILKLNKIHVLRIPRPILIVAAVVYSAATLLYSTLWMIDARVQQDLSSVELGFGTDFIPAEGVQFVRSVYPASPAEKAGLFTGDKIFLIDGNKIEDANFLQNTWRHRPDEYQSPRCEECCAHNGCFSLAAINIGRRKYRTVRQ